MEVGYQTVARGCDLEAEAAGARVGAVGQLGGGSLQSPPLLSVNPLSLASYLTIHSVLNAPATVRDGESALAWR